MYAPVVASNSFTPPLKCPTSMRPFVSPKCTPSSPDAGSTDVVCTPRNAPVAPVYARTKFEASLVT